MRITCVIGTLGSGGAERVMTYLCDGLARRGHQVTLLTLDATIPDFYKVSEQVKRVKITLPTFKQAGCLQGIPRLVKLTKVLGQTNPEVVISFMTLSVLASCLLLKVPYIYADHLDIRWLSYSPKWRILRNILLHYASAVTVLSNRDKRFLQEKHPSWNSYVIYNPAVSLASTDGKNPCLLTPSRKWVVAVGRLEKQKGFDRLLDMWERMRDKFPSWALAIFGDGSMKDFLVNQIAEKHLESSVYLFPPTKYIHSVYEQASLYVMPSRTEGFPMVLLEAMSEGLPVVSFACVGADVIVRDQVDGFWVPQDDTNQFIQKMSILMQDEKLRNKFGNRAKEILSRFSLEDYISSYENLCKHAVRQSN